MSEKKNHTLTSGAGSLLLRAGFSALSNEIRRPALMWVFSYLSILSAVISGYANLLILVICAPE